MKTITQVDFLNAFTDISQLIACNFVNNSEALV